MFTVTRAALDRLSNKLARRKPTQGLTLRLARTAGGWRLRLGRARPEDRQFGHDGQCVLLLDGTVSEAMAKMKLDVSSTDSGPRLRLLKMKRGKD